MRSLFLCTFLLLGQLSAKAQHMFSRQFPFFNQLSSNEVGDIHQDREGYLWIGTTNGLARYDRYRLLNFRSDYKNQNLLANNAVINIDDSELYVWIGSWSGVNLYDKQTCQIVPFPDERLLHKPIRYIAVDRKDNAWVGADWKIYRCDSTARITKVYELIPSPGTNPGEINSIYIDKKDRVWVMAQSGLFRYDPATDAFVHYPPFEIGTSAYTMFQDKSGNYWLGTWGTGLWQFFPDNEGRKCYKQQHVLNPRNNFIESIIFSIEQDDTFGYLWMLSYAGLHALRYTPEGTLENVDINDLIDTQMMYTRICKDKEGNLWLGSYDMGYTIFFDSSNVDNYTLPQLKKHMGWDANILNLGQSNDGTIWFDQDRYGLCLYNPSQDLFADSGLGQVNLILKSLYRPGVWVNSSYSPHVMRITQRDMKVYVEEDIPVDGVTGLIEDKSGNLWISTWVNLQVKRPDNAELIVSGDEIPRMASLTSDMNREIWGISTDRKIYRLRCIDGHIVHELRSDPITVLSAREVVNSICIDRDGRMWLNTSLGRIFRSDESKQQFELVSLDNTIDDSTILGMLADQDNVWIIANKKVLQYNIDSQTFFTYSTADDNIMVDVFRYKAISLDGRGGLYVGGHRGYIHIQPGNSSSYNQALPRLHITDVRVEHKSVFFDEASDGNTTRRVSLRPNDRNIEIFFSPLLYSLSAQNRMAYQLEGVDNDWIYLGSDKASAFYNQLSKGTYKLSLKLEYERGKWTQDEVFLTIVKTPAFYETWLAYLIYIVIIGVCLYAVIRFYTHRIKRKNEVKLQEEMTRTKLTYFTNVSHELLTPLTVISCISDNLDQSYADAHQHSVMLKANVDKLKRLIQQVLDFRKNDVGKLRLNVSEGDIREFILDICRINFLPLAQKKNISLETHIAKEEIRGYADFDMLDKVLHNLLSNAIKYTPENKSIRVGVDITSEQGQRMLLIKVHDTGIGIPARELEHIFTRFYSSRKTSRIESNGIGLSLTKDLVSLHHGIITVESVLGEGTCFTVKIPVDKNHYSADELMDEILDMQTGLEDVALEQDISADDTEKPTLLLIDDNTELLTVMKGIFRDRYNVQTAVDGESAWEKLINNEIDIIICDVMLPDTNGWELCTRIKDDLDFNHIPIIMLTAKNGIDDRVASYNAGADGYIAKPFESKILFARVDNLIKASKTRQAAFRREDNLNLDSYPSAHKHFLQAIINSIERHLEEPEFDLRILSTEVNMSKSTLYRKIKSTTGMTPLDFVRNVKMKRACMMLLTRTQNISEIAYSLGFSTPKYFTKCFKKEFDITPSEYLQKHSE